MIILYMIGRRQNKPSAVNMPHYLLWNSFQLPVAFTKRLFFFMKGSNMKDANFGFPGDNVRITETIENCYEVPYLDHVITQALNDLDVKEKFKLIRYMIRTFKKDYMFPNACYIQNKKDINMILKRCHEEEERFKSAHHHFKSALIFR